jgi:hypothetical protein
MARNIKDIQQDRPTNTSIETLGPDELKAVVRDGLVQMALQEREDFIRVLEDEMRRAKLNMRSYLIPLGIPARVPGELTPTEVGHLVRYLKINVPQAMAAVERALARYSLFGRRNGKPGDRLAA